MLTPLRYAGGKSKALKIITSFIDEKKIISPFIGGGSLEVYWASLGKQVIGYDIFYALTNFWSVLLNNKSELLIKLKEIIATKEKYDEIKEILLCWSETQELLKDWKTDYYKREPIYLDNITSAAYFFFNHNLSYGPGFLGWPSKIYLNNDSWEKMIKNIEEFEAPTLKVYNSDFIQVLEKHNKDFLYLDPPYYIDDSVNNKMFKGIYPQRNIPIFHDKFPHKLLRDMLKKHKGDFILSYNNCDIIREYYSEYNIFYPKWHYSMGAGEIRIGKNRKKTNSSNKKESHEVLILSKKINNLTDFFY